MTAVDTKTDQDAIVIGHPIDAGQGSARRLCYFLNMTWGDNAVSYHLRALANELVGRGHQVVILVDKQNHEPENHDANPAVYTWPSPRPTRPRDALFLYRLIRKYRPDCLFAAFGSTNVMTWVGWATGVPCRLVWYLTLSEAIEIDGKISPRRLRFLRFRKRFTYKRATHVTPNSHAGGLDVQRVYGVPKDKCHVLYLALPDPLDADDFQPGPRLDDRPLCVGRLHPTKGQDVLIRAMAHIKGQLADVCFDFVGDGPSKQACMDLAVELGVAQHCNFVGRVPHSEVLPRMAQATFTVAPSRSECFGLVNIESLAVGTPVVASDVGGISEIFDDGQEGFLVPPDDPELLADRMKRLLDDADLRRAMSERARRRFMAFEQRRVVTQQADWLESVVCNRVQDHRST